MRERKQFGVKSQTKTMIPIIIINLSLKEANSKLQKASIKKSQTQFITIEILTKLTYECP